MYAVMNKKGKLFVASDVCEVRGRKLIFVSNGEFVYDIRHTESGEIYTPGNGHNVGSWGYADGQLYINFVENSGDLRQLANNLLPYYGAFNIVTKEVNRVRWRIAGRNTAYNSFAEMVYNSKRSNSRHIIEIIEGIYNIYGKEKVVCNIMYNRVEGRVVGVKLLGISAESINEVFNYFGNCKFTGNVNTIAVTNGLFTEFGTYRFIDIKENEHVFKVKDWSSRGYVLMKEACLKQLLDRYNKAQQRYKIAVEEYELKLGIDGKYTMNNCRHCIYFGGTPEE